MSTLVAQVRELAGASTTEASDARIIEALNETSERIVSLLAGDWETTPDGTDLRTAQAPIGRYRVEATGAVSSVTPPTLHDDSGTAITDPALTITQQGIITAAGVTELPDVYVSGRVFDVYAAAVEIIDLRIATIAGAFDFKRGDQSFDLSQKQAGLERLRRQLAKRRVKHARRETAMSDQALPPC